MLYPVELRVRVFEVYAPLAFRTSPRDRAGFGIYPARNPGRCPGLRSVTLRVKCSRRLG